MTEAWFKVVTDAKGAIVSVEEVESAGTDELRVFFVRATSPEDAEAAGRRAFNDYYRVKQRERRNKLQTEGKCPWCGRQTDHAARVEAQRRRQPRASALPSRDCGAVSDGGAVSLAARRIDDAELTREQRRSRRKREVQKTTISLKHEPKEVRVRLALLTPPLTPEEEALRPKTRGDCENGIRPCPWVSCRHHLALDVNKWSITLRFPDLEIDQMVETCALDVAEHGGESLESVGDICNLTRERTRQIEVSGLMKMEASGALAEFKPAGEVTPVRSFWSHGGRK